MALFIRNQFGPYTLAVWKTQTYRGRQYEAEMVIPTFKFPACTPHGRHDTSGAPGGWGPDKFGYTDFDDYHLALYGA